MLKHRQHHVWQRYLKSWAVKDKLFCLMEGRIFDTNTINVALERDFYKLHQLNSDDLQLIRKLVIDPSPPLGRQSHEEFLNLLISPRFLIDQIKKLRPNDRSIEDLVKSYEVNTLEDYHGHIESRFVPLLERILVGDISFYSNDQECIDFLYFVCTQYMRTSKIKSAVIENVQNMGLDLTNIWNILVHMFANNMGASLFVQREKRKLSLVHNKTNVPFITGDQPIINLYAAEQFPPTRLAFYYPISPLLALVLGEADEESPISNELLTSTQATDLNEMMFETCKSQVFGHSEASLLPLLNQASNLA